MLILPSINGEATAPAPRISVTLAVVLTFVTVVGIIAHLDHLARGLQVGNLARAISVEGRSVVEAVARTPADLHEVDPREHPVPEDASAVPARRSGWVSQVGIGQMLRSVDPGTTIRMETRVGAYIHEGEPLFTVHSAQARRTEHALAEAIDVAAARTMLQDVDFAIRQLVDIGLRALRPAVNDPTTAVEILLRLGTLMRKVLTSPPAPLAIRDEQGRALLQPWNLHPDEFVEHAFDQIRQSCLDQPEVVATLLRVLRMLIAHVHSGGVLGSRRGPREADASRPRDGVAAAGDPPEGSGAVAGAVLRRDRPRGSQPVAADASPRRWLSGDPHQPLVGTPPGAARTPGPVRRSTLPSGSSPIRPMTARGAT